MSTSSDLREALKDLKYPLGQGGVIVRQWQLDEIVDAILDAVIEALPEIEPQPNEWCEAGMEAYKLDVIHLLQSAKTKKDEE